MGPVRIFSMEVVCISGESCLSFCDMGGEVGLTLWVIGSGVVARRVVRFVEMRSTMVEDIRQDHG